jgi:hypothetical protein
MAKKTVPAASAEKRYVCNRWPFLKIRAHDAAMIEFEGGLFKTADAKLQDILEAHSDYGIHIHPQDPADFPKPAVEEEAPPAPEPTLVIGGPESAPEVQTAAPEGTLVLPPEKPDAPETVEFKVQAGKAKAEELKKKYGEPVKIAGNWYTFRKPKGS